MSDEAIRASVGIAGSAARSLGARRCRLQLQPAPAWFEDSCAARQFGSVLPKRTTYVPGAHDSAYPRRVPLRGCPRFC